MIQRILKNKNSPSETAFSMNLAGYKIFSQGKNAKALLVVLFLAFGVLFLFSNDTKAAVSQESCKGEGASWNASTGTCSCSDLDGQKRVFSEYKGGCAFADTVATGITGNNPYKNDGGNAGAAAYMNPQKSEDAVGGIFVEGMKWILSKVLELVGWLFAIAATLFAWVVDPANVSGDNGMLNKQAVKDVWVMVRDLLNMGFIMVLLFAAFGTIFQVDSLNLKKVWLNILINALLVNFSYPIARFIIDISNVTFYYLLNNLFVANGNVGVSGSSVFAGFGDSSNLAGMLVPADYASHDIAYLVASIIVVFILGMTLFIIAALFVVRLVVLTMLVMFSPIGFVGYILPDTRKYAKDWWTQLLNYSFFAPIMIFGMAISLRIIEAMRNENFQSFVAKASPNATADQSNWIAGAAFYAIPIIILWSTIGIAKKFGIEGAGTVTGTVTKWGKKIANNAWSGTKWAAYGNPIGRGVKEGVKERSGYNKFNKWLKSPSNLEAAVKGSISNAYKDGKGGLYKEGVAAYKKSVSKGKTSELDDDVKKAVEKYDTESASALVRHLQTPRILAKAQTDRDKGIEFMAKYKQLQSDPQTKSEYETHLRSKAVRDASTNPAIAGIADPSLRQAAIEAHVQKTIAKEWSNMKSNYKKVKKAHT